MRGVIGGIAVSASVVVSAGGCAGPQPAPDFTSLPVHAIQGLSASSPVDGRQVTFTGVVTGDFQSPGGGADTRLEGFFVQGPPDADPMTSEGIFVFDGPSPPVDVNVGDAVRVSGTVQELAGETRVVATDVRVTGSGSVPVTEVRFPVAATTLDADGDPVADLERYEGMLVRIPQTLTVAGLNDLERLGEVSVLAGGRAFAFTNAHAPDVAGFRRHLERIAARSIVIDDGSTGQWRTPIPYRSAGAAAGRSIRVGDQLAGVTGNLSYSRGGGPAGVEGWRLMPTAEPVLERLDPRPPVPTVRGDVRVASFNVFNYFSTIDDGREICGPSGDAACRGADSVEEHERQLAKIVTALALIDADVVGLIELENNDADSLETIVVALNAATGPGTYAYVDTGTIGTDAIKNGFLYKPATMAMAGAYATLDASVDPRFNDGYNRPALAQTFRQHSTGAMLTVVVNHLKSKGSPCDAIGDPDTGDGQANCNRTRTAAAAAMVDWLAGDPTMSGDADLLIIGDLNAHFAEDPLRVLTDAGYTNLLVAAVGAQAYSYVFDRQSGALDHALASASLVPQAVDVAGWHINADEAPVIDYNLERGRHPGLFDPESPFRASDHDPIIVDLRLTR